METISTSWSSDFGPYRHFELLTSCTAANKHRNVYYTILVSILSIIQTEGGVYPRLLSLPGVGNHALRFLFLSRGLDPQGPHPKIREISPIASGETESKFGSFI